MNQMASITVVIPCYNAEYNIDKCIKSLIEQTYKNFEVIFVDDASTDGTVEVLKYYIQQSGLNAKIICNDINCGPAVSRNKGIQEAQTEYITFCDSDDWYDANFLLRMKKELDTNNSELVLCGYNVVNEKEKRQRRPISDVNRTVDFFDAVNLESDSLCMLMVRTSIMKETLLPNIRNGEDVAVVPLLMSKSNRISIISDCLYYYYRREDSASQKPTMKVVESIIESFNYTKEHFPLGLETQLEYLGIKNMLYSTLITLFDFSYDTEKANSILDDFESSFPNWKMNNGLSKLPTYKRIILSLAKKRCFLCIKIIAKLRTILI